MRQIKIKHELFMIAKKLNELAHGPLAYARLTYVSADVSIRQNR